MLDPTVTPLGLAEAGLLAICRSQTSLRHRLYEPPEARRPRSDIPGADGLPDTPPRCRRPSGVSYRGRGCGGIQRTTRTPRQSSHWRTVDHKHPYATVCRSRRRHDGREAISRAPVGCLIRRLAAVVPPASPTEVGGVAAFNARLAPRGSRLAGDLSITNIPTPRSVGAAGGTTAAKRYCGRRWCA
jgi:hypothetical protein